MSTGNTNTQHGFFGKDLYKFLALVVSVPVFIITHSYMEAIQVHDDEAVAVAATACFIAGIFTGRYMAQFWTAR